MDKRYLFGMDVFRCILVITIFLFHANVNMGVEFGILTEFLKKGSVAMVMFFMLSGFSLYYTYCEKEILEWEELKKFYWKRICSIYPLYIICHIIYIVMSNDLSWKKTIFVLPIELTATQSTLNEFYVLHNSMTWFVSCLSFCYFLFPFLVYLIKNMKKTTRRLILMIVLLLDICGPFITYFFELDSLYRNPFYRILDFILGIFCACVFADSVKKKYSNLYYLKAFIASVVYITLITCCAKYKIPDAERTREFVTFCNYLTVPFSMILLLLFARGKEIGLIRKPLKIFSDVSYAFYLVQIWVFDMTRNIMKILWGR